LRCARVVDLWHAAGRSVRRLCRDVTTTNGGISTVIIFVDGQAFEPVELKPGEHVIVENLARP
jgi:hypothetical protein